MIRNGKCDLSEKFFIRDSQKKGEQVSIRIKNE